MKLAKIVTVAAIGMFIAVNVFAAETVRQAKIISVTGDTVVKKMGQESWAPAKIDMMMTQGDMIKTGNESDSILDLGGSGTVEVKPNSQLSLAQIVEDSTSGNKKTLLDLAMGEVFIKADKLRSPNEKFEVKTPTSIVGVRGTKFSVKVEAVK